MRVVDVFFAIPFLFVILVAARFFGQAVAGVEADEIYVYPSPLPAAVA